MGRGAETREPEPRERRRARRLPERGEDEPRRAGHPRRRLAGVRHRRPPHPARVLPGRRRLRGPRGVTLPLLLLRRVVPASTILWLPEVLLPERFRAPRDPRPRARPRRRQGRVRAGVRQGERHLLLRRESADHRGVRADALEPRTPGPEPRAVPRAHLLLERGLLRRRLLRLRPADSLRRRRRGGVLRDASAGRVAGHEHAHDLQDRRAQDDDRAG